MNWLLNSESFRSFAYYSSILGIKVGGMSVLTSVNRYRKKAVTNPEDFVFVSDGNNGGEKKVMKEDPTVERIRRAHLNDLENILPFFAIGLLYCTTRPRATTATLLFRVFTAARILHTIVYAIYPVRQPTRALAFLTGLAVNMFMAFQVIVFYA